MAAGGAATQVAADAAGVIFQSEKGMFEPGLADLFEPVARGIIAWDEIGNLGELVTGKVAGRQSPDDITVFKQNSDQGVGFMALAGLAYEKARAAGIGTEI